MSSINNKYIDTYINNHVKCFRDYSIDKYTVCISGLSNFITNNDYFTTLLIGKLNLYGFEVTLHSGQETIEEIQVEYYCEEKHSRDLFEYRITNLVSLVNLSNKTGVSIIAILIMQIVSMIICRTKILYKAIILDLDDTIWKGTLAEDGFDSIKQNLLSNATIDYITFARFIQKLSSELGLYVAICSRNCTSDVLSAIERLDENEFPLKGHIDCIVANHNDKSKNIEYISNQLSVLTNACVFIDDNQLVRDEVRQNLPEVFVPEWNNHDELITLFMACGIFDRFELSFKSRNRKHLYEIIQTERKKNHLPQLYIKVKRDLNHIECRSLYAKSNQFRFAENTQINESCESLVFEMYRDNKENLGICSSLTLIETEQNIRILNWAISCRYFEIGLEEFILMHILTMSSGRQIIFSFEDTGFNNKTISLLRKYKHGFSKIDNGCMLCFSPDKKLTTTIRNNTNLKYLENE